MREPPPLTVETDHRLGSLFAADWALPRRGLRVAESWRIVPVKSTLRPGPESRGERARLCRSVPDSGGRPACRAAQPRSPLTCRKAECYRIEEIPGHWPWAQALS